MIESETGKKEGSLIDIYHLFGSWCVNVSECTCVCAPAAAAAAAARPS